MDSKSWLMRIRREEGKQHNKPRATDAAAPTLLTNFKSKLALQQPIRAC